MNALDLAQGPILLHARSLLVPSQPKRMLARDEDEGDACNGTDRHDALITAARRDAGIDIEMLSGRQEVRLLSLSAREGTPDKALSLLMDLDEFGARLVLMAGEEPIALWELALRMRHWAEAFANAPQSDWSGLLIALRTRVGQIVCDARLAVLRGAVPFAIATSGIAGAAVALASDGGKRTTLPLLRRAIGRLLPTGPVSSQSGPRGGGEGLMVSAAIVLETILDHIGIDVIQLVDRTLGHGVIVDTNRRSDDTDRGTPTST